MSDLKQKAILKLSPWGSIPNGTELSYTGLSKRVGRMTLHEFHNPQGIEIDNDGLQTFWLYEYEFEFLNTLQKCQ